MADPDLILRTVHKAADYFRQQPGRTGLIVDLAAAAGAAELFVVGDLHGNRSNFQAVLRLAELDRHRQRHIVFQEVVHGPFRYPNDGCISHQLVDLIAALKCQYPERVHYIAGNHEVAELRQTRILKNGESQDVAFRAGLEHAYGTRADEIHEAYRTLFASLPIALRTESGVFVCHSLPSDGVIRTGFDYSAFDHGTLTDEILSYGSPLYRLLWGRETTREWGEAFLRPLRCQLAVTGHLACPEGYAVIDGFRLVLDASTQPAFGCIVPVRGDVTMETLLQHLVQIV